MGIIKGTIKMASAVIGTISGIIGIGTAGLSINNSIKENYDDKEAYSEDLYRMIDEMDAITNLYDTVAQREELLDDTLAIIGEKNLDPTDVLSDIGGLMSTGDFDTTEEALEFGVMLRQLLHSSGKTIDEVNNMMPEIIEGMASGKDLHKILGDDIELKEFIDTDGEEGISVLDLQTYLFKNQSEIDKLFSDLSFTSADEELIKQSKEALGDRIVTDDYYAGIHDKEETVEWQGLVDGAVTPEGGLYVDKEGENPYFIEYLYYDPYSNPINLDSINSGNIDNYVISEYGSERYNELSSIDEILSYSENHEYEKSSYSAPTKEEIDAANARNEEKARIAAELEASEIVQKRTDFAETIGIDSDSFGNVLTNLNDNLENISESILNQDYINSPKSFYEDSDVVSHMPYSLYNVRESFENFNDETIDYCENLDMMLDEINGNVSYLRESHSVYSDYFDEAFSNIDDDLEDIHNSILEDRYINSLESMYGDNGSSFIYDLNNSINDFELFNNETMNYRENMTFEFEELKNNIIDSMEAEQERMLVNQENSNLLYKIIDILEDMQQNPQSVTENIELTSSNSEDVLRTLAKGMGNVLATVPSVRVR